MARARGLTLAALGALYALVFLLLVVVFPPTVNPDATAYLRLAEHYADGRLEEAVVSHWAPLYTWLLVPAAALGIPLVPAAAAIQCLFAIATLAVCWLLLGRLSVDGPIRLVTCLGLIPLLLRYAYQPLGPDLLAAALYLAALLLVTDRRWRPAAAWPAVAGGALAGVAYLTKGTAALAIVLVILMAGYVLRAWRSPQPALADLRGPALVLVVAAALAAPWVLAISFDEDHPTLGTSAAYTWAVEGPGREHPTTSAGLLEPPHARAVSAWEDPARLDVEPWSPLDDPRYALEQFAKNAARYGARGLESVPLAALVALAGLLVLTRARGHLAWALAGVGLLIPLAYSVSATQERYAWASYLLVVLLAGVAVAVLVELRSLSRRAGIALLVVSLVVAGTALSARKADVDGLKTGDGQRRLADALRKLPGRRVAAGSDWHASLGASFLAERQFLGVPRAGQPSSSVAAELDALGVDGFMLWDAETEPGYLGDFARGPSVSVDGTPVTLFSRRR